jgi:Tellurite resistance protein TerB
MALTPDVQLELLKVLVTVAWADHRVVRTEADMVRDVASKLGLSDAARAHVDAWLTGRERLPAPDYARLRPHKAAVLAALRTLVRADDGIAPEEAQMLQEIEAALA